MIARQQFPEVVGEGWWKIPNKYVRFRGIFFAFWRRLEKCVQNENSSGTRADKKRIRALSKD